MRNIIGEEDIFVKYLKPEMDIVEFDESVLTTVDVSKTTTDLPGAGGVGDLGDGSGI